MTHHSDEWHTIYAKMVHCEYKLMALQRDIEASIASQNELVTQALHMATNIRDHHTALRKIITDDAVDWLNYQDQTKPVPKTWMQRLGIGATSEPVQ